MALALGGVAIRLHERPAFTGICISNIGKTVEPEVEEPAVADERRVYWSINFELREGLQPVEGTAAMHYIPDSEMTAPVISGEADIESLDTLTPLEGENTAIGTSDTIILDDATSVDLLCFENTGTVAVKILVTGVSATNYVAELPAGAPWVLPLETAAAANTIKGKVASGTGSIKYRYTVNA